MKFLFPVLTIVVCIVAAYFSWTVSEKFTATQAERLEAIETNKVVTANADAADIQIKDLREELAEEKDKLEVLVQSVNDLESTKASLVSEIKKQDGRLAAQNAELAELDQVLKEVQTIFADLGGGVTMDNLGEKVEEIEQDLQAKQEKSEELDTLVIAAEKLYATKQGDVKRLVDRKADRDKRISDNAREARVTAVNQDWGFLVVGAGSNAGYTPEAPLILQRNGKVIGRVTPAAIEPTQIIADIDFDSLAPGVRIQPGDTVILEKPASN